MLIYEPIDWNIYDGGRILHKVESVLVTQMNFQWREGVYDECALYEELIRDDGKVLRCVMRFFEENCPTYAMTETKRLGPKKGDQAARRAVENAISEEERQTRGSRLRFDKSAGEINGRNTKETPRPRAGLS